MSRITLEDIVRPKSLETALRELTAPGTIAIGGGTDLTTLILDGQCNPSRLIEIGDLPELQGITTDQAGTLRIGAAVRLSDAVNDPSVLEQFPALAEALLAGASPQLRAMATIGGNLMQRTRCVYFRAPPSTPYACNKRTPGTGCAALTGFNRGHAILGGSRHCVAVHPSDLAVALVAFDATVVLRGPGGERQMPVVSFLRFPGDTPERDTALEPGELIVGVLLKLASVARRARYVKVRDRASYEFALASAAVGIDLAADGVVRDVRVAAGGVATVPWRLPAVENALKGEAACAAALDAAARLAADGAHSLRDNAFKAELLRRTVRRALELAWRGS